MYSCAWLQIHPEWDKEVLTFFRAVVLNNVRVRHAFHQRIKRLMRFSSVMLTIYSEYASSKHVSEKGVCADGQRRKLEMFVDGGGGHGDCWDSFIL